jgi:methionine-rich copper-binding protein CopC
MRRLGLFHLALVAAMAASYHADAHAFLKQASPAVGSTVPAPTDVVITFTEGVEPAFSSIVVQDSKGDRVDTGDVHAASGDGLKLAVELKPLVPGAYTVIWHATSVDTHKTEGRFVFTVGP